MLMILVLHARFDGILTVYDGSIDLSHITQFSFEALSIVGVNLFILISGYWGINLKRGRVVKLLFQIYFFGLLALAGWLCSQGTWDLEKRFYIKALFPVSQTIWFIPNYVMLMLFSPALNVFVEKYSIRYIVSFTLVLYALAYWWNTVFPTVAGFGGYSWGWFLILYLTGRVIRNYTDRHAINWRYALLGYILGTFMLVGLAIMQNFYPFGKSLIWSYDFPLIYLSSICLFLCFVKLDIGYSRVINWLAASAFAVLLLHVSPFCRYNEICKSIYEHYSGISCVLLTALYIMAIYLTATIIDQLRLFLYKRIPFSK